MRNFFPFMTTNPEVTGIRADFIYANYIIACVLPLFVIFLCIRMVSNTKKAGAFTILLTGLFVMFHWEEMRPAFISIQETVLEWDHCDYVSGNCVGLSWERRVKIMKKNCKTEYVTGNFMFVEFAREERFLLYTNLFVMLTNNI